MIGEGREIERDPAMGSRPHHRALRSGLQLTALVAFGAVLAVLLVEASLQVAAFWVWRNAERRPAETSRSSIGQAGRVVLCVGDSYTYGEGASAADMAYPSQLQRLLDDARDRSSDPPGVVWRTVNDGWPGRNSSELLQRLHGLLVKERPDYVPVLVGTNNRWSHKEMDLPPPGMDGVSSRSIDEGQWQWRFRTLRLLQIAIAGLSWAPAGPGTDATSHRPRKSARAASPASPDPRSMGDTAPQGGPLSLQLKSVEGLSPKGDPSALATANHMLDDLRPRVSADDDLAAAELLIELLGKLRRHQDAIDDGLAAIAKFGKTTALCGRIVTPLALVGRLDEALVQANEAERLQQPGHQEAWLYSARSLVHLRMHDFPGALRDSVLAYSLEPHDARLEEVLRRILSHKRPSYLRRQEEALDLPLAATMRDRVHAVVLRVLAEGEQSVVKPKLEDDLRRIVALVKESGAQPVLLTYPLSEKLAEVLAAERAVARETHVPIVDLEPVFRELLKASRREQYFVSDNHCTDAGYHIMADYVMRMLLALEASHAS